MKHGILTGMAVMAMATAMAALTGCATEPKTDRNKLEFGANSGALLVGDTSDLWKASRTVILANGRESKENDYTSFHLVSSDTTVAAVIRNRQLVGRKAGEVTVKGLDDNSNLQTETSIKVTVSDKP